MGIPHSGQIGTPPDTLTLTRRGSGSLPTWRSPSMVPVPPTLVFRYSRSVAIRTPSEILDEALLGGPSAFRGPRDALCLASKSVTDGLLPMRAARIAMKKPMMAMTMANSRISPCSSPANAVA
jgi:hypothetical protein